MKSLHPRQSARSLCSIAASIALAIASTVAPSLAGEPGGVAYVTPVPPGTLPGGVTRTIGTPQSPPTLEFRRISVTNYGFYTIGYKVSYNLKSTPQLLDSGQIRRGGRFSFSIPSTATNIELNGEFYTNFPQPQPVFRKQLDRLDTNLCLTLIDSQNIPQISTCN